MNKIKTLIIALALLSFTRIVYAQDPEFYLQKARQRLTEGYCTRAEISYNTYKDLTHKTNKEIERLIEECKSGRASESDLSGGKDFTETAYGLNMRMIYVEGGTFTMGCTSEQGGDCYDNELPNRRTTVSSFYMGMLEVTQSQWEKVMGTTVYQQRNNVSSDASMHGTGPDYPMYYVSWLEAEEFCSRLSQQTGKTYRLPTEAEWEYAARGGKKAESTKYSGSNSIGNVAWYKDNSSSSTHPCGSKQANALGIYDMSGNVYEWCEDYYGYYIYDMSGNVVECREDTYLSFDTINPKGDASPTMFRKLRGGSWDDLAGYCRVSFRNGGEAFYSGYNLGFRVVLSQ